MNLTREDINKMAHESVSTAFNSLKLCFKDARDQEAVADLATQVLYIKTVSNNAEKLTNDAVKISFDSLGKCMGQTTSEKAVASFAKQLLYYLHEAEK